MSAPCDVGLPAFPARTVILAVHALVHRSPLFRGWPCAPAGPVPSFFLHVFSSPPSPPPELFASRPFPLPPARIFLPSRPTNFRFISPPTFGTPSEARVLMILSTRLMNFMGSSPFPIFTLSKARDRLTCVATDLGRNQSRSIFQAPLGDFLVKTLSSRPVSGMPSVRHTHATRALLMWACAKPKDKNWVPSRYHLQLSQCL